MRKRIISILAIASVLLSGCGEYDHPHIREWGTKQSDTPIAIEVVNAKPGLKSYRIEETEDGVDVILHYDKKE